MEYKVNAVKALTGGIGMLFKKNKVIIIKIVKSFNNTMVKFKYHCMGNTILINLANYYFSSSIGLMFPFFTL